MAKIEDFSIGCKFEYDEEYWTCVDIGRKHILAVYFVDEFDAEEINLDDDDVHILVFDMKEIADCTIEGVKVVETYNFGDMCVNKATGEYGVVMRDATDDVVLVWQHSPGIGYESEMCSKDKINKIIRE